MFADDAALALLDDGQPVTWTPSAGGAVRSGVMLFDQPSELVEGSDVISRQYLATFETAAWPGLKRNEVLTIAGTGGCLQYRLRTDPRLGEDGVFSAVNLTKV